MNDIIKVLYADYKQKCMTIDMTPTSFDRFKEVHEKAKRNVLKVHDKNTQKNKIPVCVIPIDSHWFYWVEIRDEKAVVNFIDSMQFDLLFHQELKDKLEAHKEDK